jgi:hypothetical protein
MPAEALALTGGSQPIRKTREANAIHGANDLILIVSPLRVFIVSREPHNIASPA